MNIEEIKFEELDKEKFEDIRKLLLARTRQLKELVANFEKDKERIGYAGAVIRKKLEDFVLDLSEGKIGEPIGEAKLVVKAHEKHVGTLSKIISGGK